MTTINIAKDYSDTPLGRFREDSNFNGERFRDEFLKPALEVGPVTVELDGVEGFGSSFLEEAFGGLIRKGYFTKSQLVKSLTIAQSDPAFRVTKELIWRYINEAQPE